LCQRSGTNGIGLLPRYGTKKQLNVRQQEWGATAA
jgi:hypothetical protein